MLPIITIILGATTAMLLILNRGLHSDCKYHSECSKRYWLGMQENATLLAQERESHAASRDLDGKRLAFQADQLMKLRKHCARVKEAIELTDVEMPGSLGYES